MKPTVFDLTLEQQFQMKLIENAAQNMSFEQMQALLLKTSRLLMIKDNIIKDAIGKTL